MSLETLPPELWSMVFDFLTIEELFHIFYELNRRFRSLLQRYQCKHVDLRAISRLQFNRFRDQNLPSTIKEIISLRFSTDEDCLQQIYSLFSCNYALFKFIQLQSLSLNHVDSMSTMYEMVSQLKSLPNLTRLIISDFNAPTNDDGLRSLINLIWSLPQLVHLHLQVPDTKPQSTFPAIQTMSKTMKSLELFNFRCRQGNLIQLFENTPSLHYLHLDMISLDDSHQHLSHQAKSIKRLRLFCDYSWTTLTHFLQLMPNLNSLTIKVRLDIRIDGIQWENFITHYLSHLTRVRFVINYVTLGHSLKERQVKYIIDSFRTPFWLGKFHLCLRSDWLTTTSDESFYLYTLPYTLGHFHNFTAPTIVQTETVCSHSIDYHSYDNVHHLNYDNLSLQKSMDRSIHFGNLHRLSVTFPVITPFPTAIPSFAQLQSLHVTLSNDDPDTYAQLQSLLAHAPRLYSLKFLRWPVSRISILDQVRIKSIRHLDLSGCSLFGLSQYLSSEQCHKLVQSDVLMRCEVLYIRIHKRESILDLIRNLNNLRVLVFECFDYKWEASCNPVLIDNGCLSWLKQKLPATYKASREPNSNSRVRVWLQ